MQFEQLVWSVKQLLKTGGVQQLVLAIAAASAWGCGDSGQPEADLIASLSGSSNLGESRLTPNF
jgi:hypothetical protein